MIEFLFDRLIAHLFGALVDRDMMKQWIIPWCCLLCSCVQSTDVSHFDGDWQALMYGTEALQFVEDLRFDCAPFSESFFLRVRQGVVAGFMQADENYSFVTRIDDKGRFRAHIPTNSVYSYKEAQIQRESPVVLTLEGRLSGRERAGVFTIGDTSLDGQGCATDVRFVTA